MIGYQGRPETARTHFAATSGQWRAGEIGEAMIATTMMIAADHGSGNQGKRIYFPEDSEKKDEGVFLGSGFDKMAVRGNRANNGAFICIPVRCIRDFGMGRRTAYWK